MDVDIKTLKRILFKCLKNKSDRKIWSVLLNKLWINRRNSISTNKQIKIPTDINEVLIYPIYPKSFPNLKENILKCTSNMEIKETD